MEDDEILSFPAALTDSHEFHVQREHESPPDSTAQCIVAPRGHGRPFLLPILLYFVIGNPPNEASSIIRVHSVSVHRMDPLVLPFGHITGKIFHDPLTVHCLVQIVFRIFRHRPCLAFLPIRL